MKGCEMIKTSSYATLWAALMLAALTATTSAKPSQLTNTQLDRITAGTNASIGPIIIKPPVWKSPLFPPVINPGGPILISCIVGSGCIIRAYL